jgi:hypothetical protein
MVECGVRDKEIDLLFYYYVNYYYGVLDKMYKSGKESRLIMRSFV